MAKSPLAPHAAHPTWLHRSRAGLHSDMTRTPYGLKPALETPFGGERTLSQGLAKLREGNFEESRTLLQCLRMRVNSSWVITLMKPQKLRLRG